MSVPTLFPSPQLAEESLRIAGYITVSFFTILLYDHITSLDEEASYIWAARWSTTKVLYILNRTIPIIVSVLQCLVTFQMNLDSMTCNMSGLAIRILNGLEFFVVGAVLTLRVYHLWSHRSAVQYGLLASFAAAIIATVVLVVHSTQASTSPTTPILDPAQRTVQCVRGASNSGSASNEWKIFIPILAFQTFLFSLTVLRVSVGRQKNVSRQKNTPILRRLLRDGFAFYIIVFCCLAFILAAELSGQQAITIPIFMANIVTPALSVCVSRLMLSIRSLAARLSSEPTFLLNNAEMTGLQQLELHGHHVQVREGATDGELFVEVLELKDLDTEMGANGMAVQCESYILPVMTRVGVFERD